MYIQHVLVPKQLLYLHNSIIAIQPHNMEIQVKFASKTTHKPLLKLYIYIRRFKSMLLLYRLTSKELQPFLTTKPQIPW